MYGTPEILSLNLWGLRAWARYYKTCCNLLPTHGNEEIIHF